MRILHRDPKSGLLRVRLDTASDVWRLSRVVQPGDLVGAVTTRRDSEAPSDTPNAQRDRRTLFLTVKAERIEFHDYTGHVRVTGPIAEGAFDLGRHHTLDLEAGMDVAITKPLWTAADQMLVDEGVQAKDEPTLVIVCADWGDVAILRLRGRAISTVDEFSRTGGGKDDRVKAPAREKDRAGYLDHIIESLKPELGAATSVIIAGPGFLKEDLSRLLGERVPAVKSRLKVLPTAEAGTAGVHELLRSGRAAEVLTSSVAASEAAVVERLVQSLGTPGRSALGPREVQGALEAGAVETLLVLDKKLREPEVLPALDLARQQKASVLIVRHDGEPGKRLAGLGGLAALLRYTWNAPAA